MQDVLVGLDLGTSSCKAGLVSLDGVELAHARVATPWQAVPSGAELDADDLMGAVARALDGAIAAGGDRIHVVGVGVASQAEAGFLVGSDGRPLHPAIAWFDGRGDAQAGRLAGTLDRRRFASVSGLPLTRLCSLAKYLWLREDDERSAEGRRWLSLAEWVVWRLGGEQVTERSLASRTGFFDLATGRAWDEALAAAGAPQDLVGEPRWAGADCGRAAVEGPLRGATLTVAGMDHMASAVGAGIADERTVLDSCGTAEAFVLARRTLGSRAEILAAVDRGITVGWHAIPGHAAYLAALRSGALLRRVLDLLGRSESEVEVAEAGDAGGAGDARGAGDASGAGDARATDGQAGRRPAGHPLALRGDDPAAVEILEGSDPHAVWLAAVDHVTALGAKALGDLLAAAHAEALPVVACGGWIRSDAARRAKAAALGGAFRTAPVVEAGTRGAALLAGHAAGIYPSIEAIPSPLEPGQSPAWAATRRQEYEEGRMSPEGRG